MTFVMAVCVTACVGVSVYLLLGRDLKGVAMGVFLLGHGANLSIMAMSGSPVLPHDGSLTPGNIKSAPILGDVVPADALAGMVDPLPQALILTAIVIGFAVMAFLLTLLIITNRSTGTLVVDRLADEPVSATLPDELSAGPSQPILPSGASS